MMLLIVVRVLAVVTALGTAVPVMTGAMTDPVFLVADLILAGLLVVGAVGPRRWAEAVLCVANAYALGVFTTAWASRSADAAPVNPLLAVAMAACALALVLLAAEARSRLKRP